MWKHPTVTSPSSFIGIHLAVNDVKIAGAFYRLIGLAVPPEESLGEHIEIDMGGGVHLALSTETVVRMYDPGFRPPTGQPGAALQFHVDGRADVDEMFVRLTDAGYHGHLAPVDAFWGDRYAEVDDPDGNIVGFHSRTGEQPTPTHASS